MSEKYKSKGKNYRARNKNDHDDFFPTYHALTRILLDNLVFNTEDKFLEPCAGSGDITKVLREYKYNHILQCDIEPRCPVVRELDFIKDYSQYVSRELIDHIITNPPFKKALEFMTACSFVAGRTITMLWPLDYLHGIERYKAIYRKGINGFQLEVVFPFVRRPLFGAEYDPAGKIPTGATSFAWFHFVKVPEGNALPRPVIEWLHNELEMGRPTLIENSAERKGLKKARFI
jgi:hypothetical protein